MIEISTLPESLLLQMVSKMKSAGNYEAAKNLLAPAVQEKTASAELHFQMGQVCLHFEDYQAAHEHLAKATFQEPDRVDAWRLRFQVLNLLNDPMLMAAAQFLFARTGLSGADLAAESPPQRRPGQQTTDWEAKGDIFLRDGKGPQAIMAFDKASALEPHSTAILRKLAKAYQSQELEKAALTTLDRASGIDPDNVETLYQRAQALFDRQSYAEALSDIERAGGLGLRTVETIALNARCLRLLNRAPDAVAFLDQALQDFPQSTMLHLLRAQNLQSLGDFDSAGISLLTALKLDPFNGHLFRFLATTHKFTPDDPLIDRLLAVWDLDHLEDSNRAALGFALAKAMEETGKYDQVFTYLTPANKLVRKNQPYDISTRRREIDRIKEIYAGFDPKDHPLTNTDEDFAPIFVTGLPRSGTTLVEQIISSHSHVSGAGEVDRLTRTCFELTFGNPGFSHIDDLSPDQIRDLASDYVAFLNDRVPGARCVSDKSLQTYLHLPLIWLAFPKAKVFVVRRDPRDNLLSIYKNLFGERSHEYAYDLNDLVMFYQLFDELICFWKEIAPDRVYEVSYEELIGDSENQIRQIISNAGLEWEPACLEFQKNRRQIDTLSVYQVRQPVYNSSVGLWRKYENEMRPLTDALPH